MSALFQLVGRCGLAACISADVYEPCESERIHYSAGLRVVGGDYVAGADVAIDED